MDTVLISVIEINSSTRRSITDCISFNFYKERYTPYSEFYGSFLLNGDFVDIIDIEVYLNNILVHKGLVDKCEIRVSSKGKILTLASKGYSSALDYNGLENEIIYGVSLQSLVSEKYNLPFVTYQGITETANYLYIKENATLWNAVVNLSLKQKNTYPFISYPNQICFLKDDSTKYVAINNPDSLISYSTGSDYSKIVSHFHMRDIEGTYNSINAENQFAVENNIIRHKHINFDKQWLALADFGLGYRIDYSMRGRTYISAEYKGFNGEDICDRFSIQTDMIEKNNIEISAIRIKGNKNGVFTALTGYYDEYCNK